MPSKKSAAKSTAKSAKKPVKKSVVKNSSKISVNKAKVVLARIAKPAVKVRARTRGLMARRPHRSFKLTKRRDYKRSLKLPGYWNLTTSVWSILWQHKKLFVSLAFVYVAITVIVSGLGQQESYANLVQALKDGGGDLFKGNFGAVAGAGLLLLSSVTTGLTPDVTQAQTVIGSLVVLFAWLTTVWLLRNIFAGNRPKLRDGLYNSGAPVLSTAIMSFIVLVQLLPAAIAMVIYNASSVSGLLDGGPSAMLAWSAIVLLALISVYWITSSAIAMIIVTLPGVYPMQALRAAGDIVVGRRIRILFRLVWMVLWVILAWIVIMIPIILLDSWLKGMISAISWLPVVPLSIIFMSSITLVYSSAYIYIFYRKIVDDDADPA